MSGEGDSHESERREAVLDAALALFAERTFDGTPVPLIAERAGIAAGTIYHYFRGKEELVNVVHRRAKRALLRAITEGRPDGVSERERFRWLCGRLAAFAAAEPAAFRFIETHQHDGYLDAESRAAGDEVMAAARRQIEEGQAAGQIKAVPAELLVRLLWGAFVGLVKADATVVSNGAALAETERCLWDMLRA